MEVELEASVTDDDADNTLTYAWSTNDGRAADVAFDPTNEATTTWTAPAKTNAEQAITLTLTVTDPGGLSSKKTVTIRVSPNQTPTIDSITIDGDAVSFKLVSGGDEVALVATASDEDGDDLTYAWSTNDGRAADVAFVPEDAATTTWTAPAAQNSGQAITLTLRVSDSSLYAIATINITVEANTAPTVEIDTEAQTVLAGAEVQLTTTVTDEDTGSLEYQWQANGGTFSENDIHNPKWTAPSQVTARTSYTLTVIVTDNGKPNGLTHSDAVTITVRPNQEPPNPNRPPSLTIDTAPQTVGGGATIELEATVTDADTSDTHTFAWTGRGDFDNAAAKDTEWTAPARLGSAQSIVLRLTVTDSGGLEDTKTVTITVSANTIPSVVITGDRQRKVDGNADVQLTVDASDPDNDDLTYQWRADPPGGSFANATEKDTTWTAPDAADAERAYTLALNVEDTGGLENGDAITVIVRANQAPWVEIDTAAITVDGEAAVSLTVDGEAVVGLVATAGDPDDEDGDLRYRWTADPNYGTFADRNALTTTWTAPATPNVSLPINLTLTVSDPDGLEGTDTVTITVRGSTTAPPPPPPRPQEPDRDDDDDDDGDGGGDGSDGGGGGDGSGGGGGGGGGSGSSEFPKLIGENGSAKAWELANNSVLLEIHNPDDPDNPRKVTFGIGSINTEGTEVVPVGYVRDDSLGQTYAVLRRESDDAIVRRWIAPDSALALIVPWADVNANFTFPVLVIVTIPLDEKRPHPNQLVRRFDGGDDRILSYDANLLQWRHVPDMATFQVLEFYWCDVTAADENFFDRIHIGIPHPATTVPARENYPSCRP